MDERIAWRKHVARVQHRLRERTAARLEAIAEANATEATAEIGVPLGDIPRIIYSIFGSYGAKAVDIAACESGLLPWRVNESSGAAGLFQLMPFHWWGKFDPFDPVANTRYAYSISNGGTNWGPWAGGVCA